MQYQSRARMFLTRLWELQADAGFSDAALARLLGVAQSNVSRARRDADRGVSVKFLLGACDAFPELVSLLFPDLQIGTDRIRIRTGETRRGEVSAMLRLGDGGGY